MPRPATSTVVHSHLSPPRLEAVRAPVLPIRKRDRTTCTCTGELQQRVQSQVTDGAPDCVAPRVDDARRGTLAVFASRGLGVRVPWLHPRQQHVISPVLEGWSSVQRAAGPGSGGRRSG